MGNIFTDAVAATPATNAGITYSDLKATVGQFLGYSPTFGNWTDAQLEEIAGYVQSGVRNFYYPPSIEGVEPGYSWSFLTPTTTLDTTGDDAAQDLPDDFGRMLGAFHYEAGQHRSSIIQVSEGKLLSLLSRSAATSPPQVACIRYKSQEVGSEQVQEVVWWPIPDDEYTLSYRYEAYTGPLSASYPYPLGGRRYAEVLTESCLAVAEQRANDEAGLHTASFHTLLRAAIEMDRQQGARYFGPMASGGETVVLRVRHGDTGATYPITYGEDTW